MNQITNKTIKPKHKLFVLIALCYLFIPIFAYLYIFNKGLSTNSQDWGAFGSYLGGIYGALFGFLSVIILTATLLEMQKTNKKQREDFALQLANADADKKLSDVIMLAEMINKLINSNPKITDKKKLPYHLAGLMDAKCIKYQVTEEHELYEAAIDLMRDHRSVFLSEVHVLGQLVKKINSIEDEDVADSAKAIVKGLIHDSYRFWLYCYTQVWNLEGRRHLKIWHDFCDIPGELDKFLPDPHDVMDDYE